MSTDALFLTMKLVAGAQFALLALIWWLDGRLSR